jgi:hypothetical protein
VPGSAELLLHPVRLRIVQAFLGDRALTTSQLSTELSDVPAASLYRQVGRLVRAGVLQVVAERRVRGAIERTYVLRLAAATVLPDDLAAMSPDEHRQAFLAYVAALQAAADRYFGRPDFDLFKDRVAYRFAAMWLDDAEYDAMLTDLYKLLAPLLANAPRKGRRRRILGYVLLPGEDAT